MQRMIDDVSAAHAALARLHQEFIELAAAVASGDRVMVVDELVDVMYYVNKVREAYAIPEGCVTGYGLVKSTLRSSGLRNKSVELRLAAEFIADHPSQHN